MSSDDAELEAIRQRKLSELQARASEEEVRRRQEAERSAALRVILTPEARQRLANLKMARPELAETVENYLLQLAQSGKITTQITDDILRQLLEKLTAKKRETRIIRMSRDI
ncbi:MAG: DNA-binding protein [Aigarchaeota archaeon]|nr:DNA-binding protein [Aigarchaeota archaeon]